ncbi:MAG: rod shape-determining protein MreC [Microscillaceae bacterium]|nr:rod shape-determining protein MreC [Microscillaceae bacterium]
MRALFLLVKIYRYFLLFLALEGFCLVLIFQHNHYQNAVFLNSASYYSGLMLDWTGGIVEYFSLRQSNRELAEENRQLRQSLEIERRKRERNFAQISLDSGLLQQYEFVVAKVINNSTHRANNYITINKGLRDGIKPGMGVIGPQGVVGKVQTCTAHYCSVLSLLHSGMVVSALVKKNEALGRVKWEGRSYRIVKLLEIANYLDIKPGDSIVSSGFGQTFPPQTMIGKVKKVRNLSQTFWDIEVELSTPFERLKYVYIVKNRLKPEIDSLSQDTLAARP